MRDDRRRFIVWGLLAAVFAAVALLGSAALFGSGNSLEIRLLGAAISTVSLIFGAASLGLVARGMMHAVLTGVGSRLRGQTEDLLEAQERHFAELNKHVAHADERSQAALLVISDAVQVNRDTLESMRLNAQTFDRSLSALSEKIFALQEQTRAARLGAIEGRDTAKKLLNVVRSESKAGREDALRVAAEVHTLQSRIGDIDTGQRRALNFLRREGNIQIVLDRLEASERRMLNSVEGGALTVAEELADRAASANAALRDDLIAVTQSLEILIGSELDSNAPRAESMLGKIGSLSEMTDRLSGSIVELGIDNTRMLQRLEESSATSLALVDASLQNLSPLRDDVRLLSENAPLSRAEFETFSGNLRDGIHDLRTRSDELQQALEASQSELPTELTSAGKDETSDIAPALTTLVRLTDVMKNDVKALHRHLDRAGVETVRQTEALLQLLPRMKSDCRRLPASGGFAMAPDSLLLLSDLIAANRPKRILEIGSGTSTIWMGSFAESIGSSVVSIDHLEEYRARTQNDILDFGLDGIVDLRLAELTSVDVMGETKKWYDLEVLKDLADIDLVVVDGPPESTGPSPRSPAFPLVRSMLSDLALIVVDDLHRDQEAQMVEDWLDQDPDLTRTNFESTRTIVLEYRRGRFGGSSEVSAG